MFKLKNMATQYRTNNDDDDNDNSTEIQSVFIRKF